MTKNLKFFLTVSEPEILILLHRNELLVIKNIRLSETLFWISYMHELIYIIFVVWYGFGKVVGWLFIYEESFESFKFTYIIVSTAIIAAIIATIITTGTIKRWQIIFFIFAAFHFDIYSLNLKLVYLCYYSHRGYHVKLVYRIAFLRVNSHLPF